MMLRDERRVGEEAEMCKVSERSREDGNVRVTRGRSWPSRLRASPPAKGKGEAKKGRRRSGGAWGLRANSGTHHSFPAGNVVLVDVGESRRPRERQREECVAVVVEDGGRREGGSGRRRGRRRRADDRCDHAA